MTKVSESAPSWVLALSSFTDPSWIVSPYLTECAFPSRRGSSRWGGNLLHHIPRSFLRFPWSIVRRSSTFPLLRRPRLTIILFWITWWWRSLSGFPDRSSLATDFPGSWYPYEVLPGFDEVEEDTTEGILAVKFIMGRDLAVTRSSPDSCWARFAIAAVQAVELQRLILNKVNKWFHSSRVKFPLVRMSASWLLVSMYLIWILGSRLIRSNNQSRATLWVLETCLIVGLLPLMIILITASLSSNTYNKAFWRADWTFEGTASMSFITSIFLWGLWCLWTLLSGCPDPSETRETFSKNRNNQIP